MTQYSLLKRLLQARYALKSTIQKILDLNRKLKTSSKKAPEAVELRQELKLLNKVADQQAKIVRLYETNIQRRASN